MDVRIIEAIREEAVIQQQNGRQLGKDEHRKREIGN
jgi:hypothetical protein